VRVSLIATDGSTKVYLDNVQIAGTTTSANPASYDFQGVGFQFPPAGVTTSGTVTFTCGAPFDTVAPGGETMPNTSPGVVLGPGNASITLHFSTLGLTDVHVNHTRGFTDLDNPFAQPFGGDIGADVHEITEASPDGGTTWYLVRNYTAGRPYDWSGWGTVVEQSGDAAATHCYNIPDLTVRISLVVPPENTTVRSWIDNVQVTGSPMQIYLAKDKPYYIEAIMKESDTADNLSVSTDGVAPIPGSFLSTLSSTTIEKQGNSVVITWTDGGVLQASDNVAGPYIDVPGNPASPATNAITGNTRFFKLRPN